MEKRPRNYTQIPARTCEHDDDKKTNGQFSGGVWRAFGEEEEER